MNNQNSYTVHIDGEWSLEDLYTFPRNYEQVYFMMYSLMPELDEEILARIYRAYKVFPWQGGYSAVNFYNQLKYVIPKNERPAIVSIHYASPGWLEISLLVGVAFSVERLVKSIANTISYANTTYDQIVRGMQERKILRLDAKRKQLEFEKQELEYIEFAANRMANLVGASNLEEINQRTGHPYRTLKILMSLYRRVRTLADYQNKGTADFRNDR